MARSAPLVLLALASVALGGCFRYRTLTYAEAAALCPPPPPASTPATTVQTGSSGVVAGEVVDARSGELVPLARVTLVASDGGTVAADTQVTRRSFVLGPVAPGTYTLAVVGLAYHAQRVSVVVPAAGGLTVRVPLDQHATDECPGFARVAVRRPWWQWWYPP